MVDGAGKFCYINGNNRVCRTGKKEPMVNTHLGPGGGERPDECRYPRPRLRQKRKRPPEQQSPSINSLLTLKAVRYRKIPNLIAGAIV